MPAFNTIDNLFPCKVFYLLSFVTKRAVLFLACQAQDHKHLLHKRLLSSSYRGDRQLKWRHPFVAVAFFKNCCKSHNSWRVGRKPNGTRNGKAILPVYVLLFQTSTSNHWERIYLDRPGSGLTVGLLCSTVHRWGMAFTAARECGAEERTADHIITSCPIFHHPNKGIGLETYDEEIVAWLSNSCPSI